MRFSVSPLRVFAALLATVGATCVASASLADRQAGLTVHVQNASGTALQGATVHVELLNPTFRFGDAVLINEITPGMNGYNPKTVAALQTYFNSVTLGNELKWTEYESRPLATTLGYIKTVTSLSAFNSGAPMRLRGHTTIWGSQWFVPADVKAMTDPTTLHNRILQHVSDYHTALAGQGPDVFDLYNEPFHERTYIISKLVPNGTTADEAAEIATWYKQARAVDATTPLFINEYNILNFWQEDDADVIKYKQLIDAIRDAGGAIGGIGVQGHMDRMVTKDQVTRRLDILAAPMAATTAHPAGLPGLPIEVTELDVNTQYWTGPLPTPAQQAQLVANVLDAAFEHPSVRGITMWGMQDSTHWRKNALLFDDSDPNNWKVKPSGQEWINRVKGTWWTNTTGFSDATGAYAAPVFKGKYRITVDYAGQTQEIVRDVTTATDVPVTFETEPVDTTHSRLVNLSVRSPLAANQELTIGFYVAGDASPVLIRAAGPALAQWVGNPMPDPKFKVFAAGAQVAENDNWDAALQPTFDSVYAFGFQDGSKDAALVQSLTGSATAIVSGPQAGVVLVEAYDASGGTGNAKLTNLSARNLVGAGDNILIAGFSIAGSGYKHLLIRAVGPKLADYSVTNVLADPKLELYQTNNGVSTLLASNDNWSGLADIFHQAYAFDLDTGSKDAAMVVTVPAGYTYTAQVSGVNGTTGVALVEVYELP